MGCGRLDPRKPGDYGTAGRGQNLDLLGAHIPDHPSEASAPRAVATADSVNKVKVLLAMGLREDEVAAALGVTTLALRKAHIRELSDHWRTRDAVGSDHREALWPRIRGSLLAVLAACAATAAGFYALTHRFLFVAVVTATCAAALQSIGA